MGKRERPPGPWKEMLWVAKEDEIVWLAYRDLTVVASSKWRVYLLVCEVFIRQKCLGKKGRWWRQSISPVTAYGRKGSKLCVNECLEIILGIIYWGGKRGFIFFPLKNPELATGPCLSGLQPKPCSCWQKSVEKVLSYFGSNSSICISFFSIPLEVLGWVVWIPLTNTHALCLSGVSTFPSAKALQVTSFYQVL